MCGFFSKTPPPELTKQDLELGIGNSLTELFEIRISNGFKILSNFEYTPTIPGYGVISAIKRFKGGYAIQLINSVHPENNRCDIYFMDFTQEDILKIMNSNFTPLKDDKWLIQGNQHFWWIHKGSEMVCSDSEGKCYT